MSQLMTRKEIKLPIYSPFRATKISRKLIKIADMIDFKEGIFYCCTFLLIQRTGILYTFKLVLERITGKDTSRSSNRFTFF